jgi:alkylation response protein AidB-like acyl-CoA dehydrogenase
MSDTALAPEVAAVTAVTAELLESCPPASTSAEEFLGRQFDLGLAFVHFPVGFGGLAAPAALQRDVDAALLGAGAPSAFRRNPIGVGMCGPTVAVWGSDEQKARYLRPLFTGEEIWCQLFSEPGSGSDVAGLSARAGRDGDEWVVNGQKVWTTLGHRARWGLLLARTDPDVVKHKGITAFVVDMHASGVEVRPLYQLTGDAEFNEVYFTDVRIPDGERLGAPGEGWRVTLTTLMNERVSIGGGTPPRGSGPIGELVANWLSLPAHRRTAVARDRVARLWIRAELHRLTNVRASQRRQLGDPGPEGSISKLAMADLYKDIHAVGVDLLGADGQLYAEGYELRRPDNAGAGGSPQRSFLRSRAYSIEGGTTEVMKNILAERVLGLPGDARSDRDLPWSQVPRN